LQWRASPVEIATALPPGDDPVTVQKNERGKLVDLIKKFSAPGYQDIPARSSGFLR
jgi:hypothetical protein